MNAFTDANRTPLDPAGRIVGGWAVPPSGDVVTRLLDDTGREATRAVEAEAARLSAWFLSAGGVPRIATPLARQLVAQSRRPPE